MNIDVYKFGGGCLKDSYSIRKLLKIVSKDKEGRLIVVVSAFGHITNELEKLVDLFYNKKEGSFKVLEQIRQFHFRIADELGIASDEVLADLNDSFVEIEWMIEDEVQDSYDYIYDQIVPVGELIASKVVSYLLAVNNVNAIWKDIRDALITDDNYRSAIPLLGSSLKIATEFMALLKLGNVVVTQGFIGSTDDNHTTTLGREGSDFTGAIIANSVDADSYTLWKNVSGIYDKDPNQYKDAKKIDNMTYDDAYSMALNGAKIIHPKTIVPLQSKLIPIYVRSYSNNNEKGTVIVK